MKTDPADLTNLLTHHPPAPTHHPPDGPRPVPLPTREGLGVGLEGLGGLEGLPLLRVYGRSELAHLYFGRPISDGRARKWFMEEIALYPGLMDELKARGLKPHGKTFTRAQVAAIFAAMGPP